MQYISREDLQAVIDAGTVTLIEALPEPHDDAEHRADAGLPFEGTRAISTAA